MSFCSCYKPEIASMKPCTICLIPHGPQKSGDKKLNDLNLHQQKDFHLAQVKKPNRLPYPSATSQHFKCYLLGTGVHACIYMQVIKASPNLLPNFLKMRTQYCKTLRVTQVTFLRSLTTQAISFFSVKVFLMHK